MKDLSYLELMKMVRFFYNFDYDDDIPENIEPKTESSLSLLQLHARMFALGDRYDIPGLREYAVRKYSSRCAACWNSLEFLKTIPVIYESTAASVKQLRNLACNLMRKKMSRILANKCVAAVYDKNLSELPEFTKDMLGVYVKWPSYGVCGACNSAENLRVLLFECPKCGSTQSTEEVHLY